MKASSTKRRWDSKKKDHCNVVHPDMVKKYNESMDGVELDNMLISLHCVDIQTRKRWYLKIITHLVNIYNVNGWLLYRRCSEQLRVLKKNQHNLLQFMKGVADAFLFAGKETKKANIKKAYTYKWKKPMVPKPIADIRFDEIHHWPEFGDKLNRCRVCSMLSFVYCSKCRIYLCLQKERNCFKQFND